MTQEQRKLVFEIGEEIRTLPEGQNIRVYASMETVRMQDTKHNANYRMFSPCQRDGKKVLRTKMMNVLREINLEEQETEK